MHRMLLEMSNTVGLCKYLIMAMIQITSIITSFSHHLELHKSLCDSMWSVCSCGIFNVTLHTKVCGLTEEAFYS